jgi:hypothetical protein
MSPVNAVKRRPSGQSERSNIVLYALISLASFVCATILLTLLLWKAESLTRLALVGNLYYPILLSFGLCAAVFLFGVLHSYASYRGRHLGGVLQLGGPAVVFALVVVGGRVMAPDASPFSVAVYVHGPAGPQDMVLQNSGTVTLDLDQRVAQQIGDKGQAVFPAIPPRFRNQEVQVSIQSDAYELAHPEQKMRLAPPIAYLEVNLRKGHISVLVEDSRERPISRAQVFINSDLLGETDDNGRFKAEFPLHSPNEIPKLRVRATRYEIWSKDIAPTGVNDIEVLLTRSR